MKSPSAENSINENCTALHNIAPEDFDYACIAAAVELFVGHEHTPISFDFPDLRETDEFEHALDVACAIQQWTLKVQILRRCPAQLRDVCLEIFSGKSWGQVAARLGRGEKTIANAIDEIIQSCQCQQHQLEIKIPPPTAEEVRPRPQSRRGRPKETTRRALAELNPRRSFQQTTFPFGGHE